MRGGGSVALAARLGRRPNFHNFAMNMMAAAVMRLASWFAGCDFAARVMMAGRGFAARVIFAALAVSCSATSWFLVE